MTFATRRFATLILLSASAALSVAAQPPAPADVTGDWQATLQAGSARLRLVFHITRASAAGPLTGTLDSIDQGAKNLPVPIVTVDGKTLRLGMPMVDGSFQGTLNDAATECQGTWKQGGLEFPLLLKKGGPLPETKRRPQDPREPLPYEQHEVSVQNKVAAVKLAGTLTIPRGDPPFAAVVLITGSGPQNRNEELFNHRPFLVLADHLTRQGIAVLRMDDRGVGGSTGSTEKSTSADFAGDILACVDFLKTRDDIDSESIGLVGHSEGGLIAPMVAARSRDIAFLVLMAGPGQRGDAVLRTQLQDIGRGQGLPQDKIAAQLNMQSRILDVLASTSDEAAAKEKVRAILKDTAAKLTPEERTKAGLNDQAIEFQANRAVTPWARFFVAYDPVPALKKVSAPLLALNGDKDVQVNAAINLPIIEKALKEGGNTDVTAIALPGLNHLFQRCKTCTIAEYGELDETISPVALKTISDWILARTQ
jgi:uncharacterized protein